MILPTKAGAAPRIAPTVPPIIYQGMIILPYTQQKAIHIHHWIIYFFIAILTWYYQAFLVMGFSIGAFVHGFSYKDSLEFLCNNPY